MAETVSTDGLRLREAAREQCFREGRTDAARHHPNIVPIPSAEEIDEWTVITMSCIDGRSLTEQLRSVETLWGRPNSTPT